MDWPTAFCIVGCAFAIARCFGVSVMNREFEIWIRLRYGGRYDLTRDGHGYYSREVVKRMYEVWCHCRGLEVV
ncbi:hypothetical protein EAO13_29900 [Klebsiella pneumoniae]|nr:hypothetical protein EAO13_29900 [Klebsiella pneumoniae]